MTIKWVKSDPLVMNGEPFCYGTRLTVRNLLELRSNGVAPAQMLAEHPELRRVGIAEAFAHAPKLDPSGTSWLPLPLTRESVDRSKPCPARTAAPNAVFSSAPKPDGLRRWLSV